MLAYDTRTSRQWGLPTAHIEAAEVTFKWCGIVSIATTLYATPCTSMKVLIVDTVPQHGDPSERWSLSVFSRS